MPATGRQTRQQIRQAIGLAAGALNTDAGAITHTASEIISAAKIIDSDLGFGSDGEQRGKWVLWTDSGSSVEVRRVRDSNVDERSMTFMVPLSATPTTSGSYELWESTTNPITIHNMINQAILEASRKGVVHTEDLTFHAGGGIREFALSSAWAGVRDIEWRKEYIGRELVSLDAAMSSLAANVTIATDSEDYREGIASARITVAAAASSGTDLAASSFSAVDLRGYNQLEFWYKTSTTFSASAGQLRIMQGSSAEATVSIPASSGGVWKHHIASITAPQNISSATAFRFGTGSSDGGSATVWLDDIKVTRKGSELWETVPRDFWGIDQVNREVVTNRAFNITYGKLKIDGVRRPNTMTADSAVCEIDAQYVINSVLGKLLLSQSDRSAGRRDAAGMNASTYLVLSQAQYNRMSMPSNVRWLDD